MIVPDNPRPFQGLQRPAVPPLLSILQGALNTARNRIDAYWFLNIIPSVAFKSLLGPFRISTTGDNDDFRCGRQALNGRQLVKTIAIRQLDVKKENIKIVFE